MKKNTTRVYILLISIMLLGIALNIFIKPLLEGAQNQSSIKCETGFSPVNKGTITYCVSDSAYKCQSGYKNNSGNGTCTKDSTILNMCNGKVGDNNLLYYSNSKCAYEYK